MESIFENTTTLTRQNLTEMAGPPSPVEPAGRHHPGGFGGRRRHLGSCPAGHQSVGRTSAAGGLCFGYDHLRRARAGRAQDRQAQF